MSTILVLVRFRHCILRVSTSTADDPLPRVCGDAPACNPLEWLLVRNG
jgi:hypothetical protein